MTVTTSKQTVELKFNTLPNFITLTRAILAPIGLGFLLSNTTTGYTICLFIMLAAELTDLLDGYVARVTNSISNVGKLLDPLCDSLYRLMIFIGFAGIGWLPIWMLAIFVSRDLVVAYIRVFMALNHIVFHAQLTGKIKAIVQGIAQFASLFLYLLYEFGVFKNAPTFTILSLFSIAALVTIYSGIDYIFKAYFAFKEKYQS